MNAEQLSRVGEKLVKRCGSRANIVAAEILMDSDEVLRYIYEYGYTAEQIASAMSTDINLVALKVAHLATLGYNLHALEHKSNFLK